jgi:4Fe-4S ferredoxin
MRSHKTLSRGSEIDFKHPLGKLMPVINAERCEGAGPCVQVCPVDVFTMRKLTADERSALSWKARIKVFVHSGQQAFVTAAEACRGCGLCVTACPERAITLARREVSDSITTQ